MIHKITCQFGWEGKADSGSAPIAPGTILTGGEFDEIRYLVGNEIENGEFEVFVDVWDNSGLGQYWKPWGSVK